MLNIILIICCLNYSILHWQANVAVKESVVYLQVWIKIALALLLYGFQYYFELFISKSSLVFMVHFFGPSFQW